VLTVKPSDVDAKAIGHFGFFRPEHRDTLWRSAAEWLKLGSEGQLPDGA
jgi:predicted alpha/beta hydrolase